MRYENFSGQYTLMEVLENYQNTSWYHDFEEAWAEFKADYSEELEKAGIAAEGLASDTLSNWYDEYGFKTRIVIEDEPADGDGDTFTFGVYNADFAGGKYINLEAAKEEALSRWDRMTAHDRKGRRINVVLGSYGADGRFDTETSAVDILFSIE